MSRREFLKGALAVGALHSLSPLVQSPALRDASAAEPDSQPARWLPTEPPNQPIGTAHGILPGRVVWVHDPGVAGWDGDTQAGGWYEDRFVAAGRAEQMLRETLRSVTGTKNDAAAWKSLFRYHNRQRGRGDVGYQPGEKVVVKLNLNCCQRRLNFTQGFYNTPQLTQALLRQLVRYAGVREADLIVHDASSGQIPAFLPAPKVLRSPKHDLPDQAVKRTFLLESANRANSNKVSFQTWPISSG